MNKRKALIVIAALGLLLSGIAASPAVAAGRTETVELGAEQSDYRVVVPGFIDLATVEARDAAGAVNEVTVVHMAKPSRNGDGTYTLFELTTTDPKAFAAESVPQKYGEGQLEFFSGEFKGGKLAYRVDETQLNAMLDDVLAFDFYVYDKDGRYIAEFYNVYFAIGDGFRSAGANAPAEKASALPAVSNVVVNGQETSFQTYNIGGNNYFKLRDIAKAMSGTAKRFEVKWDGTLNAVHLLTGTKYTETGTSLSPTSASGTNGKRQPALLSRSVIFIDGEEAELTAYNIGGNNYFKLRDLGKALDFAVEWDGAAKTIGIDPSKPYSERQSN
jgi:hypothetical protein